MGAALLPIALIAGAGVSVAGDVMRSDAASEQEAEQEKSIKLQESRAKAQSAAQQIERDKQEQNVLSNQKAMAAAYGMSSSSGSFTSSVLGSATDFEQKSKLGNLSLSMSLDNMEASIDQLRSKEQAAQMESMFGIGKSIIGGISDVAGAEKGEDLGSDMKSADNSISKDYYDKNYNQYKIGSGGWG